MKYTFAIEKRMGSALFLLIFKDCLRPHKNVIKNFFMVTTMKTIKASN